MRKLFCSILYTIISVSLFAQNSVFHLDSFPKIEDYSVNEPGIAVLTSWQYHKGDNMIWADSAFDDHSWTFVPPALNFDSIPEKTFENIGWFRLHIKVDTSLVDKTLALLITHSGASEIYLDGKLIHSFGKIDSKNPDNEERYDPQGVPADIRFEKTRTHVLAIRYANAMAINDYRKKNVAFGGFNLKLAKIHEAVTYKFIYSNIMTAIFIFYFTFFLALSFLHFTFFLFYRTNKSNLHYSIFAGAFGTFFLSLVIKQNFMLPDFAISVNYFASLLPDFYIPALLAMLYSIFYKKLPKIFWLWLLLFAIDLVLTLTNNESKSFGYVLFTIFVVESLRIIIAAIYKKRDGAWILGSGIITTVGIFTLFLILSIAGLQANFSSNGWVGLLIGLLVIYVTLSIPVSMTIYLARDFSRTSKNLAKKLVEVETLSVKTIDQEKEKQKILETQKEMLEVQVKERTVEIEEQKHVIEEKNKDITDSINYAKTIQEAILPAKEIKYRMFPDAFVLLKPKDIVSGDFYWFTEKEGKKLIAACDCTGHGVPGALMSMIGNNMLNQIVNEKGITVPGHILDQLNKDVRKVLKHGDQSETKDGMDVSLITFISDLEMQYAGAQRPLWIVRNNELIEIKPDKFSIGAISSENEKQFTNHVVSLLKNDSVYIFSDGYADQFSTQDKKLMTKRFKQLLLDIQNKTMPEQELHLDEFIEKWKGNFEQTDDILVIGIKIG